MKTQKTPEEETDHLYIRPRQPVEIARFSKRRYRKLKTVPVDHDWTAAAKLKPNAFNEDLLH